METWERTPSVLVKVNAGNPIPAQHIFSDDSAAAPGHDTQTALPGLHQEFDLSDLMGI